jgi:HEAT repeat protein
VGFFDIFKGGGGKGDERRNAKALATIKNSKAIKEDRIAAIEYMKDLDDPTVAVPALLQRFEYSLEHGINDTREKESAFDGILAHGQDALPLVREHLLTTSRIAWPIKVLKALGDEGQVVEILKSALDFGDVAFDQAKVDKNYDILCYLVEYKLPGFVPQIAHFLNDPDERVRFACSELLLEQDDPEVASFLERFLSDESPDNGRIRQGALRAFLEKRWKIKDLTPFPERRVADGLTVNQEGYLEARS